MPQAFRHHEYGALPDRRLDGSMIGKDGHIHFSLDDVQEFILNVTFPRGLS